MLPSEKQCPTMMRNMRHFGDPDKKHEAMSDEDKEKEAQIASIINDKKSSMINQILTASRMINPAGLQEVEDRLKIASITDIQKEFNIITPFIGTIKPTNSTPQEKIIPFYANITPQTIDNSQLTASSPDSEFSKFTTKELLEMSQ